MSAAPGWALDPPKSKTGGGSKPYDGNVVEWLRTIGGGEPDTMMLAAIAKIPADDFDRSVLNARAVEIASLGAEWHPGGKVGFDELHAAYTRGKWNTRENHAKFDKEMHAAIVDKGGERTNVLPVDKPVDDAATATGKPQSKKAAKKAARKAAKVVTARLDKVELDKELRRRRVKKRADDLEKSGRPSIALGILTAAELADRPAPIARIDGVFFEDTLAMLHGPPGSYKSFLALQWCAHIALGLSWMGRAVTKGRTLYVAAEGAGGLSKRARALFDTINGGQPIDGLDVYPQPINLADDAAVAELVAVVADRGYVFVVFDTLVKVAGGLQENDARDMTVLTNNAEVVKRANPGATVLLIHHTGKSGTDPRGSIALVGNVDTGLFLSGEKTALELVAVRQKDIEAGPIVTMRVHAVPAADSLVLIRKDGKGAADSSERETRLQEALAHFTRSFGTIGATKVEFRKMLIECMPGRKPGAPLGESTAYEYIDTLVLLGRIDKVKSTYMLHTGPISPFANPTH